MGPCVRSRRDENRIEVVVVVRAPDAALPCHLLGQRKAARVAECTGDHLHEVHAAADGLAFFVSSVPVGGAVGAPVDVGRQFPEVQATDYATGGVVDDDGYSRLLVDLVRDPGLGDERVGVVGTQERRVRDDGTVERPEDFEPAAERLRTIIDGPCRSQPRLEVIDLLRPGHLRRCSGARERLAEMSGQDDQIDYVERAITVHIGG